MHVRIVQVQSLAQIAIEQFDLYAKWGRPKIESKGANAFHFKCEMCGATWVGPNGDICEWCHKRWLDEQHSAKQTLLFPEWLEWGDSYFRLSPVSQSVWEQTRGYADNFDIAWQNRLKKALTNEEISQIEFDSAWNRYSTWIKQSR